jgi:colanic acid/amylovoran biosynthesis protein
MIYRDCKPFFLIHEGKDDLQIASKVNDLLDIKLPIIVEDDPLKIKGAIGSCHVVVSSRFHGLVSALSQAVPALGTSWSHKYRMLYEDYQFPDGLVDVNMAENDLSNKLESLIQPVHYEKIKKRLMLRSAELKQQTHKMWEQLFELMDSSYSSK